MKRQHYLLALVLLLAITLIAPSCSSKTTAPSAAPAPAPTTAAATTPKPPAPATTQTTAPAPAPSVTATAKPSPPASPPPATSATGLKDEWIFATSVDATITPDFIASPYAETTALEALIYEPLYWRQIEIDSKGDMMITNPTRPALAASWKWTDDKHMQFTLKKGIKFQDGSEFTAEDVKYTFDQVKADPKCSSYSYFTAEESVKVIDPYTVEFYMPAGDFAFEDNVPRLYILPKSRGTTADSVAAFRKNAVGTGPYKVIEWTAGKPVRLQAWDAYRDGVKKPKLVTVRYIPDASTRVAALLANEVDFITDVPIEQLSVVKGKSNLQVYAFNGAYEFYYMFQYMKPPFNDVRVRQALIYAVNREEIASKLLEGHAIQATGQIWKGMVGYLPDLKPYPYDPAKAKQLLAAAGYASGLEFTLETRSSGYLKVLEIAQAVQAYLSQVGVKVNIKATESATASADFRAGAYDMWQAYWSVQVLTPFKIFDWDYNVGYPATTPGSKGLPKEAQQGRDLLDKIKKTPSLQEQTKIFEELERLTYDQAMIMPIYVTQMYFAYNKNTIGTFKHVSNPSGLIPYFPFLMDGGSLLTK